MSTHSWCRRLVEGLEAAGVRDLVVSPGSRSTPILLAALSSNLAIHSVIDERSAGFFALGRARAAGRPVAFLCTSGTAGAHALPAMLEARYANHKLVTITADRPPELHECGANQTIDQRALFASACSPVVDVGTPESSVEAGLAVRKRVHEAVTASAGPLHINAPFRKPLEPTEAELAATLPGPSPAAIPPSRALVSDTKLQDIKSRIAEAKRGVIVAGPSVSCGAAMQKLATASGFVLLAESTSGARFTGAAHSHRCDFFPHILGRALGDKSLNETLKPDLVLRFGAEPACTSLNRWLANTECKVIRFTHHRALRDPTGKAEMVQGEVQDACRRIVAMLTPKAPSEFLSRWRAADEDAWGDASRLLGQPSDALSEASATASLLSALAPGTRLTIGNSMPIRAADMVLPGQGATLEILHQRGASGIDGLIAGAIGSSTATHNALILGDVSFSHDVSSLALAPLCKKTLRIFVIDNQGGQIFSHLPIADALAAKDHQSLWTTPPLMDMEAACRAFGVPFRSAACRDSLASALAWSANQVSCSVVRVTVAPDSMRSFVRDMARSSV